MATRKDPSATTNKWANRLKGATSDIRTGIQSVTEAPGVAAARKKDKMRNGINEAIDSGKWEKNTAAVPLSEWQSKAIDKGIQRIPAGVDGATDKVTAFHEQRAAVQSQIDAGLKNMDDSTPEARVNRMLYQVQQMSKFRYKK
jgi:hypothetical protein